MVLPAALSALETDMNRLVACALTPTLVLAFAAASGNAAAQTYRGAYVQPTSDYYPPDPYRQSDAQYDYARVIRVDPVFDSRGGYARTDQRCYQRRDYVDGYDDYRSDRYDDGYYGRDSYDPYNDRSGGSQYGGTVATVIGGVIGAAIGSQVGGGSARYATSAIGTMVGGIAGRQIYEQNRRQRDRGGTVTVCDPVPADGRYVSTGNRGVTEYDVTYEYAGRQYTTRTNYHPGDRIRVRVDVRPE